MQFGSVAIGQSDNFSFGFGFAMLSCLVLRCSVVCSLSVVSLAHLETAVYSFLLVCPLCVLSLAQGCHRSGQPVRRDLEERMSDSNIAVLPVTCGIETTGESMNN